MHLRARDDRNHRCAACAVRPYCLAASLDSASLVALDQGITKTRLVAGGHRLLQIGDPAPALSLVRSGSFKSVRVLRNGEEHVVGLHLRGELVSVDGDDGARQDTDVIALECAGACVAGARGLAEQLLPVPPIARRLMHLLARRIGDDIELQLLMASHRADERVARFLLHFMKRLEAAGLASHHFWFPLTRKDLASLLGLRLPTVSRVFSTLRDDGVLETDGRLIELLDFGALTRTAGFESTDPMRAACHVWRS